MFVIRTVPMDEFETADIASIEKSREAAERSPFIKANDKYRHLYDGKDRYEIVELPDATEDELQTVEEIKQWLIENYENGAHWVYETTETLKYVIDMREYDSVEEYKKSLQRHWELLHDVSEDIKNA